MARDSYSYLHLPMIAGIILLAVGVKKTLADIGEPLATVPAVALCGGVALYLGAHILFRLRNVRTLSHRRLVVTLVLLGLIPVALEIPALATLAVVAALCVGLIAYEAIRYAGFDRQPPERRPQSCGRRRSRSTNASSAPTTPMSPCSARRSPAGTGASWASRCT